MSSTADRLTRLTLVMISVLVLVGVLGRRDFSRSSRMAVSATDSSFSMINSAKNVQSSTSNSGKANCMRRRAM